jgi:isopentenyl diphosphate isomerase/L-lactate dehydrogenase-like FMN-dependent dehydrogenase
MCDFPTLQDLVWKARQRLPRPVWDFVTFGTETETTVRRNRQALDSLALLPRVMRDVTDIDPSATFLGNALRIPVMLAPVGSIALLDPQGAVAAGRAAERFGTMLVVSGYAAPGFATVAQAVRAPLIYALHPRPGLPPLDDLLDEVTACGYKAIAVVSEAVYYSRRERDLMSQVATAVSITHPYAEVMRQHRMERAGGSALIPEALAGGRMDWSMLERIKARTRLKLILKGVTTASDARLAVAHGVNAVYVSNHGGRALDHGRATIQALPSIVDAVSGRAEILIDGGFVRGTDVLKAIALGANAVCMGRMQSWALAAGGQDGVHRMLEILEEEIVITMALLGVNALTELSPAFVEATVPVGPAHPLGAFPVVMERIAAER